MTDKLTGLIWTQNAGTPTVGSCTGGTKTWQGALDYVTCLNSINYLSHSDWRLSNVNELGSLMNGDESNLSTWLNAQGFTNVQSWYCSSSTTAFNTGGAWFVYIKQYIFVYDYSKMNTFYVWPVRSGQ